MADETLMELIDAYAEARHVGGCHTYNAKTAEARAKVVASLAASAGSEPVAWLVGGGRIFVDKPFLSQDAALMSARERADGAKVTPLYTHPSPPEGAGWKLVPIEPTDAMWNAMMDWGTKKSEWLAILAAAPPASEAKGA